MLGASSRGEGPDSSDLQLNLQTTGLLSQQVSSWAFRLDVLEDEGMFFSLTLSLCSAAALLHNEDNNSCTAQAHTDDKIIHQDHKHCCADFQRISYKNSISFDLQTQLNAACRCSKILELFCEHKNRFLVTMTRNDRTRTKFRSSQTLPKKPANSFGFDWQVFEGLATLHYLRNLIFGIFLPLRGVCGLWKAAGSMSALDLQAQFHSFTVLAPSHWQYRAVPAAWHCHRSSTMKHPTAMSSALHPSEQIAPAHSVVVNPSAPQLQP